MRLVALGAVIRGETYHFEIVANESAAGVASVQLEFGIPIGNGILTTETDGQAKARADDKGHDAALAALEMANVLAAIDEPDMKAAAAAPANWPCKDSISGCSPARCRRRYAPSSPSPAATASAMRVSSTASGAASPANSTRCWPRFAPYLDRAPEQLSPIEKGVLVIGAWELLRAPDTPYRVVINEAVELAKAYGGTDGHKYVNGVLDKLAAASRAAEVGTTRVAT